MSFVEDGVTEFREDGTGGDGHDSAFVKGAVLGAAAQTKKMQKRSTQQQKQLGFYPIYRLRTSPILASG